MLAYGGTECSGCIPCRDLCCTSKQSHDCARLEAEVRECNPIPVPAVCFSIGRRYPILYSYMPQVLRDSLCPSAPIWKRYSTRAVRVRRGRNKGRGAAWRAEDTYLVLGS
ncbi:hypothetical protein GGI35DRAFT_306818 [Trichoderma velutinum]